MKSQNASPNTSSPNNSRNNSQHPIRPKNKPQQKCIVNLSQNISMILDPSHTTYPFSSLSRSHAHYHGALLRFDCQCILEHFVDSESAESTTCFRQNVAYVSPAGLRAMQSNMVRAKKGKPMKKKKTQTKAISGPVPSSNRSRPLMESSEMSK